MERGRDTEVSPPREMVTLHAAPAALTRRSGARPAWRGAGLLGTSSDLALETSALARLEAREANPQSPRALGCRSEAGVECVPRRPGLRSARLV